MNIKENYQKSEKKHNLPGFDSLNNEFEINDIEETEFLLREIRRKITKKIDVYVELLEGLLYPAEGLCDMHECRVFSEAEKNRMFELYKKLMFLSRLSVEISIDENDSRSSDFINQVWKHWAGIKKELLPFVSKVKDSWLEETDIKEEPGYMG